MKRNKQSLGFMVNWTNMARESCPAPIDTPCNYISQTGPQLTVRGMDSTLAFILQGKGHTWQQ